MKDTRTVDVLLVEDNEDDAVLIQRILKPYLKNELIWLKNGEEVLNYFPVESVNEDVYLPRVIFLDLKMPKMDGIETIKAIKTNPFLRTIPIVVITSSNESNDRHKCYNLGINSYIIKPIDYSELVENIKDLAHYWLNLNVYTPRVVP